MKAGTQWRWIEENAVDERHLQSYPVFVYGGPVTVKGETDVDRRGT